MFPCRLAGRGRGGGDSHIVFQSTPLPNPPPSGGGSSRPLRRKAELRENGVQACPPLTPKKPKISGCSATIRRRRGAAAAWFRCTRAMLMSAPSAASSFNGPEGFTVHDVRDPRRPKKVGEFRAPPGVHCHKLRIVGDDLLYVNSERLAGDKGKNARAGFFIFDVSKPATPKPIGFYDMPGSGPHRFGVDLERQLAFMPNDAPGWDRRVIWTLDIRDPLRPEVVSIWGLPWMKNEIGRSRQRSASARGSDHAARPADDPRQPHVLRLVGRRHLDHRLHRFARHEACRPHQMVAAVSRLDPYLLADRRPALSRRHRRGARQGKILGRAIHVDHRRARGVKPAAGRDLHARARKIFRPARPFRRAQHFGNLPADGPWKDIVFLTYFNAGLRAVDVSDPLHPKEVGCYVPETAGGRAGHPVERHRRR